MRPVRTLLGSNPGETFVSCAKLLIINPAPTSRMKLREISEMTNELRHRRRLRPLVADLDDDLRTSLMAGREAFSVGTTLNRRAVKVDTMKVNAMTFELMLT